jgi:hypothetical protein
MPSSALEGVPDDNQHFPPLLWSELAQGLHDLGVNRLQLRLLEQDDQRSAMRYVPVSKKPPVSGYQKSLFRLREFPEQLILHAFAGCASYVQHIVTLFAKPHDCGAGDVLVNEDLHPGLLGDYFGWRYLFLGQLSRVG